MMEGGQGWISVMDSHSQAVGPPLTDNSSGGRGLPNCTSPRAQITQVVIPITSVLRKAGHAPRYQRVGLLNQEHGDVGRNLHASVGSGCAGNGHDQLAVRPRHAAGSSPSNIDLRLADIKAGYDHRIISSGSGKPEQSRGQRASLNIKSFPQPKEVHMLNLLAFVVVAVGLATPFVVPLMWGQLENPESAS